MALIAWGPLYSMSEPMKKVLFEIDKRVRSQYGKGALDAVYKFAHDMAWGGDQVIRMASYNYLKSQGYSPQDAAQLGAMVHGDYPRGCDERCGG